jgi:hypothetical protein
MVAQDRFRTPLVFGGLLIVLAIPAQLLAIPVWHERGAAAVTGIVAMACGLAATAAVSGDRQNGMLLLAKALLCGAVGFGIAHRLGAAGLLLVDALVGVTSAMALMHALGVLNPSHLRDRLGQLRYTGVERNGVG